MPLETAYNPTLPDRTDWTSNGKDLALTIDVGVATQRFVNYHLPVKRAFLVPAGDVDIGMTEACDYDSPVATATYEIAMPLNGGIIDLYDWFVVATAGATTMKIQYIPL